MIRGCKRNVIIIKNTDSEIFEEAIFIVRSSQKDYSEKYLKREAMKIIADKTNAVKRAADVR